MPDPYTPVGDKDLLCPFCRARRGERCRHLVADHRWGRWVVPGVLPRRAPLPTLETPQDQLFDWSDAEQRRHFRSAYPLICALNSAWNRYRLRAWSSESGGLPRSESIRLLVEAAGGTRRIPYPSYCQTWRAAYFSRNPDAFRARAQRILGDWKEGYRRLAATPPAAARSVVWDVSREGKKAQQIAFSPDGRWILVRSEELGLHDIGEGGLRYWYRGKRIRSARFLGGAERVVLESEEGLVVWRTMDVAAERLAVANPGWWTNVSSTMDLAADGESVVYATSRSLRTISVATFREREIRLLRSEIDAYAVSPDGRFAAVGTEDRLMLVRLPRSRSVGQRGGTWENPSES